MVAIHTLKVRTCDIQVVNIRKVVGGGLAVRARVSVFLGLIFMSLLLGLVSACSTSATTTPMVVEQYGDEGIVTGLPVPGIIDSGNVGWPRLVEGKNGVIEITERPQRVVAPSLGHTEILVALVDTSRVVGVSRHAYNPDHSNVLGIAKTIPGREVQADAEIVVSLDPDLVIESAFVKPEYVEQLEAAGITVVQTQFDDSIDAIQDNIRLMAYMLGEEDRGERLVQQVEKRIEFVIDTIGQVPEAEKPRVLMLGFEGVWTGGTGTYNDDTISRAGGINLPSGEFDGFQKIGDESIMAMNPQVILLELTDVRDNGAINRFLNKSVLAEVDAVKNRRVYAVQRQTMTNLSHWHILSLEEVALALYPEMFIGVEFPRLAFDVNLIDN
jgi:iron complex transport system substrate-binding protein